MTLLKIINGCLVTPTGYVEDCLWVKGNYIIDINDCSNNEDPQIVDASGCYVSPGLIDIHIHGGLGCNFLNNTDESLNIIRKDLIKQGVTAFLPTVMTAPKDKMFYNIEFLTNYIKSA